jgi:hypothetical protein
LVAIKNPVSGNSPEGATTPEPSHGDAPGKINKETQMYINIDFLTFFSLQVENKLNQFPDYFFYIRGRVFIIAVFFSADLFFIYYLVLFDLKQIKRNYFRRIDG